MLGKDSDSARLLQQFYDGAYQPKDLKHIPYIDQISANNQRKNSDPIKFKKILTENKIRNNNLARGSIIINHLHD